MRELRCDMRSIKFVIIEIFGAGDEIRTHDPNLGKVRVYGFSCYHEVSEKILTY